MMKIYNLLNLTILCLFSIVNISIAATNTSITTGSWDIGSTWSGSSIPTLANNNIINISVGNTVTKTGDLIVNNNNIVFNIYGNLIINGTLGVKNNLEFNIYSGGTLLITDLTANQNATLTITGGGLATITNDMTFDKNAEVVVDGSLTVDGTITVGNGSTVSGSGTITNDDCNGPSTFCNSGPLPVELTSFTANTNKELVILSWSTASEQNNDYFTLERSKDGRDFQVIGKVEGQGTSTVTSDYSIIDQSPYLGLSFYRLSQTDFDGAFEVFPSISVVFTSNSNTFSISPNPIKNQSVTLKVSGRVKNEALALKIIDLQGRLIETTQFWADPFGNLETEIQLKKQLRQGSYIFELSAKNYIEYLKVVSE